MYFLFIYLYQFIVIYRSHSNEIKQHSQIAQQIQRIYTYWLA